MAPEEIAIDGQAANGSFYSALIFLIVNRVLCCRLKRVSALALKCTVDDPCNWRQNGDGDSNRYATNPSF
jgi:hypothetical protein